MELKLLSAREREDVMAVIKDAFAAEPWNDRWDDEAVFGRYIADVMEQSNSLALGLYDGETLAALALGRLKHWFNGVEYCIDDLCVAPAYQSGGVGTELVERVRAYCREKGFSKISLKTSRKARAYLFYQKNGFAEMEDDVFFEMECK